ncbi:MAG TPA: GNAT family N-acetyltransferase [Thermoanaerobaculia bacterium]|nr:GNAT family N-acetyltransferase [Thermoanaerobaculia bacterium]
MNRLSGVEPAIVFRDAALQDLEQLVALDAICFPRGTAYPTRVMRHYAFSKQSKSIVALRGKTIVGLIVIRLATAVAEIVTIDVLPENRGSGLGSALMQRAEDWIRARSCSLIALEVDEENLAAVSLYESHGFAVRERYKQDGKRRYVMVKELS